MACTLPKFLMLIGQADGNLWDQATLGAQRGAWLPGGGGAESVALRGKQEFSWHLGFGAVL